jgi:hypothetical protein
MAIVCLQPNEGDTVTKHEIIAGVRKTDAGHFQPFIMERTSEGLREILALQAVRLRYEAAAMAERMARDERTRREIRAKLAE